VGVECDATQEYTGMGYSTVNRFIMLFDDAFRALAVPVSMGQSEQLGILVHRAMESKTRAYHTAGHVFGMCKDMNPRQVLAALFHDLVYYQLDGGFPSHAQALLRDIAHVDGDTLVLQPIAEDDSLLALCAAVFGFQEGQVLPLYCGMNEFLSAVVAARLLEPHVRWTDLVAIVASIESTIPFRTSTQGHTGLERLAARVAQVYRGRHPDAPDEAVQEYADAVVWDAVKVTNRDVGSFAVTDPGLFLSSTWLLIEESNAPLTVAGMYTLQEYRHGLVRMDGFLRTLDPCNVFQQYKGLPSDTDMLELRAAASRNIRFACDFLGAKIASIAIVEALALCTGTDGPISMFLGDIRNAHGKPSRLDDLLPTPHGTEVIDLDLLRVFEKGRTLESSNDLTTSPITAFVYRSIGHAGMQQALAHARQMFDGSLAPQAFLRTLEPGMLRAIVHASADISPSRKEALVALEKTLWVLLPVP